MDDIRDIKPPLDPPMDWAWGWIVLALIVCALIVFFIIQRKSKGIAGASLPALPPWETAFQQLQELEHRDLITHGKYQEYYFLLSGILRHYIENRFGIRAPEMTTEEFLIHLKDKSAIASEHKAMIKDFMLEGDMVKFAKHIPSSESASKGMDLVKRFINETKLFPAVGGIR